LKNNVTIASHNAGSAASEQKVTANSIKNGLPSNPTKASSQNKTSGTSNITKSTSAGGKSSSNSSNSSGPGKV